MPFCPADGSTASACEFRGIHGIFMKICEIHDFMEKCEIHVKFTRKQPSVPEAENSSKSYAFLHGSGAVGQLFAPEW